MVTSFAISEGWKVMPMIGILIQPVMPSALCERPGTLGRSMRTQSTTSSTFDMFASAR